MVELNLNDAEGIKPIDFGGSDKEVPNEVEENVKEDSDDLGMPITCLLYYPTEISGVLSLFFISSLSSYYNSNSNSNN